MRFLWLYCFVFLCTSESFLFECTHPIDRIQVRINVKLDHNPHENNHAKTILNHPGSSNLEYPSNLSETQPSEFEVDSFNIPHVIEEPQTINDHNNNNDEQASKHVPEPIIDLTQEGHVTRRSLTEKEANDLVNNLKAPAKGATDQQLKYLKQKQNSLNRLAKEGKLIPTKVTATPAEREAQTRIYKDAVIKRAQALYRNSPEALKKIIDRINTLDVDHIHELQLGGKNDQTNLRLIDSSINSSVGSQISHRMKLSGLNPDGPK